MGSNENSWSDDRIAEWVRGASMKPKGEGSSPAPYNLILPRAMTKAMARAMDMTKAKFKA